MVRFLCRSRQWTALRRREEICRHASIRYLLESLRAVLFDGSRQIGENIAVEEDAVSRAKDPLGRWTPGQTNSRAEVIRVLIETRRQMLKIVSYAQVDRQFRRERPVILHETAETGNREIDVRIAKRLPKLIRISREKICKRTEEIYATKTVRHVGPQPDAIDSAADLPKVFALRARVRVAGLIVIFATFAVSGVRTPEGHETGDVNFGPKGSFVRRTAWRVAT